jgi:hypothetical protein
MAGRWGRLVRLVPDPGRVVPVLTVLVLLASALSVVLALTRPDPQPPADLPGAGPGAYRVASLAGPGGPAVEAVAAALPVVLGYEVGRLDEDLAAARALMTRSFARRFTASFDESARTFARRQQATVEASVRGAGLVRVVDDTTVLTLAYVDQVLVGGRSIEAGDSPRVLARYRVLVRLVTDGDGWRIDDMSPV